MQAHINRTTVHEFKLRRSTHRDYPTSVVARRNGRSIVDFVPA